MVHLGEGVESVMETLSFCCITRFLIEDQNALAMLYTRTLLQMQECYPDATIKS
jgi:hypothetical protein